MNNGQRILRLKRHDPIRIGDPREVMYWTGTWGLTNKELHDAVAAVGPMAADVAAHIGQSLDSH